MGAALLGSRAVYYSSQWEPPPSIWRTNLYDDRQVSASTGWTIKDVVVKPVGPGNAILYGGQRAVLRHESCPVFLLNGRQL